jgi:Flp pilus assembly pilin Flp
MLTLARSLRLRSSSVVRDESGQTMVEYVLMIVLIALVVILASPAVTAAITAAFNKVAAAL